MLKDHVLKTPSSISLLVPLVSLPNRSDKYKCWLYGHMEKAMAAVKDQGFTVRRAAELAGVCSGPPKHLINEEEEELERCLTHCSSVGFRRSRQQVIQLV